MTQPEGGPAPQPLPYGPEGHPRRWAILGVLLVSLLIVVLDNTIMNVALPSIQADLGATNAQLQWAIDAYILVFASLLFTWGVMGDRYGRKRVLVTGLLAFGAASVLTAFAQSPEQLIAGRALMGIGGAAVLPVTLAIISVVFPPDERGKAIGMWAGSVGIAVAAGPIISGLLLEHFWWGSVFLVNVPVVILGVAGILAIVPESKAATPGRLDPLGVLLSISGLALLTYGIIHGGNTRDWGDPWVWGTVLAGVALLALFVRDEMHSDHPSFDVRLFRNPRFSAAIGAVSLAFFALSGLIFLLTYWLQLVRGYSPLEAGLNLIPLAVGQILVAPNSARLVRRYGVRAVTTAGLLTAATSFAGYLLLDIDSPMWIYWVISFLTGAGLGATMAPSTESAISTLPRDRVASGSAVMNTVRQVAGAMGVAVLGALMAAVFAGQVEEPLSEVLPPEAVAEASSSVGDAYKTVGQLVESQAVTPEQASAALAASDEAFVVAMHVTASVSALVALLGAFVTLRFLPRRADRADC